MCRAQSRGRFFNRLFNAAACKMMAAFGLLVSANPADADWQYTRWGMTPQQVVAASRGLAKPYQGDPTLANPKLLKKLMAPYSTSNFTFNAVFVFETTTNRLTTVHLVLSPTSRCPDLKDAMIREYGAPQISELGGSSATWRDSSKGNLVYYLHVPLEPGGHCEISYRPLRQHDL